MMDAPMAPAADVEPPADDNGLAAIMETLQKLQAMIAAKMAGGENAVPPTELPPEGAEDAAPPLPEGEGAGGPPAGLAGVLAKLKAKRSGPPAVAAA